MSRFQRMSQLINQALLSKIVMCVVCAFAIWVYWPGHTGPELLDDRSNLTVLENVATDPALAMDRVFGNSSGPLGRPISMLSFVAEKILLDNSPATSKIVNICLHGLNGFLLFLLLVLLFKHINLQHGYWFAVALAGIWLVSPIMVSTVLYNVQRMALLSTTFMFASCIAYVDWRNGFASGRPRWGRALFFCALILLGIFAKENAVVVLPVLVLLECFWMEARNSNGEIVPGLRKSSLLALYIGLLAAPLVLLVLLDGIVAGYRFRDFNLHERLLTQSRVLWDYVAQMVWPSVDRMGVFHDDYVHSRSLFEPITTLWSVVGWGGLVLACIVSLRWQVGRWVSCGVFVFLAAHSVESSFFSLELYFEHRNYFPSLGLLLVIAGLLAAFLKPFPEAASPVLVYLSVAGIILAMLTSSQVTIWSSAPLLRLNHVSHHPQSARANEEMAIHLASVGAIGSATEYSAKAQHYSTREGVGDRQLRDLALYCLAGERVPEELFSTLGSDKPNRPFSVVSIANGLVKILQDHDCANFDQQALSERLSSLLLGPDALGVVSANFYLVFAGLENALENYNTAFEYVDLFLLQSPNNTRGQLMKLHFATALGKVGVAEEMIAALQAKQAAGELNVGEQQTLALYTEQP